MNTYASVVNPSRTINSVLSSVHNLVGLTAAATDEVRVNDALVQGTDRQAEFWRKELATPADNASGSRTSVNIKVNGVSQTLGQEAGIYFPRHTEELTHDRNGNLVKDSRWEYAWDAENRLASMWTRIDAGLKQSNGTENYGLHKKLIFSYDWRGRRIKKTVYTRHFTTGQWNASPAYEEWFVYNDWKLVFRKHTEAGNNFSQSFVWGPDREVHEADLTSSVGGLHLMETVDDDGNRLASYFVFSDLSRNVVYVASDANPTDANRAMFGYGPFGEIERFSGGLAANFPFRFSSEFTDHESGLVYYGHRYYNPRHGRWLSRDPGEDPQDVPEFLPEGPNLYAFVGNDPVNRTDYLGRIWIMERQEGKRMEQKNCDKHCEAECAQYETDVSKAIISTTTHNQQIDAYRFVKRIVDRCDCYCENEDPTGQLPFGWANYVYVNGTQGSWMIQGPRPWSIKAGAGQARPGEKRAEAFIYCATGLPKAVRYASQNGILTFDDPKGRTYKGYNVLPHWDYKDTDTGKQWRFFPTIARPQPLRVFKKNR